MLMRGARRNDSGLPDDVPEAFRRSVAGFSFVPAARTEPAKFDAPMLVRSSHPQGSASAAWAAVREKANAVRESVQSVDETASVDAKSET